MRIQKKFLVFLGLIALSFSSISQAQNNTMVGVQIGDSFQFNVVKNDFSSAQVQEYMGILISDYSANLTSISDQYDFSSVVESINQTMLPTAGTIITVNVTKLPVANTVSGKLSISYNNVNVDLLTGFMLGTPIVFTDWNYWFSMLNTYNGYTHSGFSVQTNVANNTATFNSTVKVITNNVPVSLQQYGFTQVSAQISAGYNVTSGVLNQETFTVALTGTYSSTFVFTMSRYNKPIYTNISQSTPGFEIIGLFASMSVLAVVYNNNKKKN